MRSGFLPALLLLAACGGPEANVESRDPYERYLGVSELPYRGDAEAVRETVRFLDDPHYLVVVGALESLARLGDPAFLQHPASKLDHPHWMVRAQACATIGAIGNPEGVPLLTARLQDSSTRVRRAAVKALARFGDRPEAVRALVEAVGQEDPSVSFMAHEKLVKVTGRTDVERSREAWSKVAP